MCYNIKSERREKKRNSKRKKWIKHQYGENWGKAHGINLPKKLKKILLKKEK